MCEPTGLLEITEFNVDLNWDHWDHRVSMVCVTSKSRGATELCMSPVGSPAKDVYRVLMQAGNNNNHSPQQYDSHSVPNKHFRELDRERLRSVCPGLKFQGIATSSSHQS